MKSKSVLCAVVLLAVGILMFGTGCSAASAARENSRAIACTSNLKQIVLGILLFADDNSDKLPAAQEWEKKISSYVGDEKTFVCPKTKQHYLYFGNGQETSKIENRDTVILLVCESDHVRKMNVAFLDGHCASMDTKTVKAAIEAAKAAGNDALPVLK